MNIEKTIIGGAQSLKNSNIKNPYLDSELLMLKVINKDRKYIILNSKKKLSSKYLENFKNLVCRRKRREPIAYLINSKEFWKQKYFINKHVLIPRPDSEILVEETLKLYEKKKKINLLDVGTGSGCLLLSILKERKNFLGTGVDISKNAINTAQFNAKVQKLNNRVKFYISDIDKFLIGKYDLILSNPPYIKKFDLKYLDEDILLYEPKVALDGGSDGFSEITKVINKASDLIKRNGKFILEIGYNQKNETINRLINKNFYINKIVKDYGKNDRCIISTKI